jgi:hypothetical protein
MNINAQALTSHHEFSIMYTNTYRSAHDTCVFIDGIICALVLTNQISSEEKVKLSMQNRDLYNQYKSSDNDE